MNERVLNSKFKKVYSKEDVKNWIKFGLENKVVRLDDRKGIIDWIKILDGKNINL